MYIIGTVIAAVAVWTGVVAMILHSLHHAARVRDRIDATVPASDGPRVLNLKLGLDHLEPGRVYRLTVNLVDRNADILAHLDERVLTATGDPDQFIRMTLRIPARAPDGHLHVTIRSLEGPGDLARLIGLVTDATERGDIAAADQYEAMASDLAHQNTMREFEQLLGKDPS